MLLYYKWVREWVDSKHGKPGMTEKTLWIYCYFYIGRERTI